MTAACAVEPPTEWKLLDAPLASAEAMEFSVVAPQAGPHQVILQFAWPIADQHVEAVVSAAAATTGEAAAPRFDVSWQMLKDRVVICERQSPQQSTGVVDTATSGLGDGPLTSRGLVLGDCALPEAGRYTLRVLPGPKFAPIAKAGPRIVVAYQPFVLSAQCESCRPDRIHWTPRQVPDRECAAEYRMAHGQYSRSGNYCDLRAILL